MSVIDLQDFMVFAGVVLMGIGLYFINPWLILLEAGALLVFAGIVVK